MKTSIHYSEEICKRLEAKKLTETISPYAMEYINTIMLAVDKYQIRSANGIKHFWLIASLAYMIACFESKRYNFSEGYHLLSQTIRREQISFIFDYFGEYCLTTFVHFHENGVGMLIYRCIFNSPTLLISSQERTKPQFVPKDVSPWKQVSVCYQIKSIEAR